MSEEIDSACAFEHSNRYQHCDHERNDPQNDIECLLCSLHELVVNLDSASSGINRKKAEEKGNGQNRQRIYNSREKILSGSVGRQGQSKQSGHNHSQEKHQEENSQQYQ